MKRHAPATLRNRVAIADVLAKELPEQGQVLEIASGSGEHAVFFAACFPQILWQPSDPDSQALASIAEFRAEYAGANLAAPVALDAARPDSWPISQADAILCCNMVHISPWEATVGLFHGAAALNGGRRPAVLLYGPYFERDVEPAPSNLAFDESLRARDDRWGIRDLEDVDHLARQCGFHCTARHVMPANNVLISYRGG